MGRGETRGRFPAAGPSSRSRFPMGLGDGCSGKGAIRRSVDFDKTSAEGIRTIPESAVEGEKICGWRADCCCWCGCGAGRVSCTGWQREEERESRESECSPARSLASGVLGAGERMVAEAPTDWWPKLLGMGMAGAAFPEPESGSFI